MNKSTACLLVAGRIIDVHKRTIHNTNSKYHQSPEPMLEEPHGKLQCKLFNFFLFFLCGKIIVHVHLKQTPLYQIICFCKCYRSVGARRINNLQFITTYSSVTNRSIHKTISWSTKLCHNVMLFTFLYRNQNE